MASSREITVSKKLFSNYKTITEAIHNAANGTKIFVEPGTYEESLVINKNIEIIALGNVDEIVLRSKNSSTILMQTEQAKVHGVTIVQVGNNYDEHEHYYAVDLPKGSLFLENCDIISTIGHGIGIYNLNTLPVIQECNIYNSKGTGIWVTHKGNPTIRNCKIYNNNQNGIEIIHKGQGLIEDSEIYENYENNIYIETEGNPILRNCKVYKGKSIGVFIEEKGLGIIENNEIYENPLNIGITREGNPVLRNCKIYKGKKAGIFVEEKGLGTIENSEIYENLMNLGIITEG
ncbi:right-handed parallel beta-helix repeat-containing protein, partial [Bacillus pseudomycoides]|uniref:right-handed parallel beta-helix repeat-containing protein n=1 Tax=Bacillus pseudomycoides TaxID=64104 RepID=UPI003D64D39A